MKEVILCKYGELALKGLNKKYFENLLKKNLTAAIAKAGNFNIYYAQSTIYLDPADDNADIDTAFEAAKKVFGIVSLSRAAEVEKDMDKIRAAAKEYLPPFLESASTFKVEGKRSDKRFPFASPQICAEVGGDILERCHHLKVDVHNPDVCVRVEIRDYAAYISAGQVKGAGGMPYGSNGKGLLLLSGGIDSPVAGYQMAKRGVAIEALHFESFPYTSERAREKVLELASILTDSCGPINVHVISVTKIQEALRSSGAEDYFTLLLRRSMMRLAKRAANKLGCGALITGESLGQVASQTMEALAVTNDAASGMPVFRPLIGNDKEEIVVISRKIGTYETSILPYEDCCTVFTPKHPKTRPELHKVLDREANYDYAALEDEAFEGMTVYTV